MYKNVLMHWFLNTLYITFNNNREGDEESRLEYVTW